MARNASTVVVKATIAVRWAYIPRLTSIVTFFMAIAVRWAMNDAREGTFHTVLTRAYTSEACR